MIKLGIIGYGAIGAGVIDAIEKGAIENVAVTSVFRQSGAAIDERPTLQVCDNIDAFLDTKPDLVLEAAGYEAARAHAQPVLAAGIPFILMSISALTDDNLKNELAETARKAATKLLVPAGALAGVDGIASASFEGIDRLEVTQKKPPRALLPEDEAAQVTAPKILDELSAREAGQRFPKNANIAAGVGLASRKIDDTLVRIVADPNVTRNTAEILAEGSFGRIAVQVENEPTENRRTSRMAILSALGAISRFAEPIVLGA